MTDPRADTGKDQPSSGSRGRVGQDRLTRLLSRRFLVALMVVGVLMVPVVVYAVYDVVRPMVAPCEAIFEQIGLRLETKISLLKTEGEVHVGKEAIQDLSERAKMMAINLKTCCIVLDAGRVNPEEFLQCKQSARQYEAEVEQAAALVVEANVADEAGKAQAVAELKVRLPNVLQAAVKKSKDFNGRIVEIERAARLAQLQAIEPTQVEIENQENEPNDNILTPNLIPLGQWISATVGHANDDDFYVFTTPERHRDHIRIEIENRSTTLKPYIVLFNSDKSHFRDSYDGTSGANRSTSIVSAPATKYYVQVRNYDRRTEGAYLLRVAAQEAYDAFEPNEDILAATSLSLDTPTEAAIMDGVDRDYYQMTTGATSGTLKIDLANRSTTLKPYLRIFAGNKVHLANKYDGTPGADIHYEVAAEADTTFYVEVRTYDDKTNGAYRLTATVE